MLEKSEVDVVEMWWWYLEEAHLVLKALIVPQIVVATKAAAVRDLLRDDIIFILAL